MIIWAVEESSLSLTKPAEAESAIAARSGCRLWMEIPSGRVGGLWRVEKRLAGSRPDFDWGNAFLTRLHFNREEERKDFASGTPRGLAESGAVGPEGLVLG